MRQYGFYLFRVLKTAGGRLLYERIEAEKSLVHELSRPRHGSVAIFHGITTEGISSGKPRPKPVFTPGQAKDHRPIGGRRTGRETRAQPYYRPPPMPPQNGPSTPTTPQGDGGVRGPSARRGVSPPGHCHSPLEIQTIPTDLAPEKGGRSMYCTPCGRQSVMAPIDASATADAPRGPVAHPHRAAPPPQNTSPNGGARA